MIFYLFVILSFSILIHYMILVSRKKEVVFERSLNNSNKIIVGIPVKYVLTQGYFLLTSFFLFSVFSVISILAGSFIGIIIYFNI